MCRQLLRSENRILCLLPKESVIHPWELIAGPMHLSASRTPPVAGKGEFELAKDR